MPETLTGDYKKSIRCYGLFNICVKNFSSVTSNTFITHLTEWFIKPPVPVKKSDFWLKVYLWLDLRMDGWKRFAWSSVKWSEHWMCKCYLLGFSFHRNWKTIVMIKVPTIVRGMTACFNQSMRVGSKGNNSKMIATTKRMLPEQIFITHSNSGFFLLTKKL